MMSKKIPKWLKNKYLLTGLVFVVWITFFDDNNLITQVNYLSHMNDLQNQKTYLEEQIDATNKQLYQLNSNSGAIQKFGREKYFMKKKGEDAFLIPKKRRIK